VDRDSNDPAGSAALVARLTPLAPALVVVEASGGRELLLLATRQGAGLPVAAINPRQARDFATTRGRRAQTARLDAPIRAPFAEAVRPAARPLPSAEVPALDALLSRRQQWRERHVLESHRLGTCVDPMVRASLEPPLSWLKTEIAEADRRRAAAVKDSPAWRQKDELLRSLPGLGPVSSLTLRAALPERGTLGGSRLSALVGPGPLRR
jgi:transposase